MGNAVVFDFSGSRVLVTGGSRGIGAGIARAFRDAGAEVIITGTRPAASDYDEDLSGYAYHSLQLTDAAQIERVAAALGSLDVLVNNGGATFPGGCDEAHPDGFAESVALNLVAAYRLSVACKEMLAASRLEGGASVLNLASMSSYFAVPMVAGYSAAKAGVVQMTKNMAVAWVHDGIRVNAVAPGIIETNMTAAMKGIEALEKPQIDRTPMARWGQPEDVAPTFLFLASEAARFITGQTYPVDGGYSIS
jgi:NAD(P)-dependent dehydrogenase (short-subunit alcohol dehydrogenase family)